MNIIETVIFLGYIVLVNIWLNYKGYREEEINSKDVCRLITYSVLAIIGVIKL